MAEMAINMDAMWQEVLACHHQMVNLFAAGRPIPTLHAESSTTILGQLIHEVAPMRRLNTNFPMVGVVIIRWRSASRLVSMIQNVRELITMLADLTQTRIVLVGKEVRSQGIATTLMDI